MEVEKKSMKTAEQLREFNKNRVIDQVCYVTDDIYRTMKYFVEMLDIGPWEFVLENTPDNTRDVKLDGEDVKEPWKFYIAHAKVGGMTIELIQPESGPDPYSEFLKKHGPGLHHIKESIYDGDDALKARMDELVARGHKMKYEGKYMEDIYYYLDVDKDLGGFIEFGNSAKCSSMPGVIGKYPEE